MKIDERTLMGIARLARLDMSDPAIREARHHDMQQVIDFVEILDKVDTQGVEPLIFMTDEQDQLRPDVAVATDIREQALANAPVKDSDYFKVPKVVGGDS